MNNSYNENKDKEEIDELTKLYNENKDFARVLDRIPIEDLANMLDRVYEEQVIPQLKEMERKLDAGEYETRILSGDEFFEYVSKFFTKEILDLIRSKDD